VTAFLARVVDALLPTQEYLAVENAIIRSGRTPSRDEIKSIKRNLRASKKGNHQQ
jgi:hypothetical protein